MQRVLIAVLFAICAVWFLAARSPSSAQNPTAIPTAPLADAFGIGWMLTDSNGDGIADAVAGKIIVPDHPTAAENAAAANFAARIGYVSAGLTLPIVLQTWQDKLDSPRILIGKAGLDSLAGALASLADNLEKGEGGVFVTGINLAVAGSDDAGLAAAAENFSSRAPYQWRVPGEKLSTIAETMDAAIHASGGRLMGVTYAHGQPGIRRAIVRSSSPVTAADLNSAFASPHLAAVRELIVLSGEAPVTATNPHPLTASAAPAAGALIAEGDTAAPASSTGGLGAEGVTPGAGGAGAPTRLDLAAIYTSRGLFTGSARMPVPAASDVRLYVPEGATGTAMANLAARMGLETTGITLPIASAATDATARQIRTQAVVAGASPIAQEVERKLRAQDTVAAQAAPPLAPGEGELRIVDDSFQRKGAVLVRGDDSGAPAALDLLSGHFPNLWEPSKQYLSLEEIRYDLHHFFSLRSGVGQAAAALYHLDRWTKELGAGAATGGSNIREVKVEAYMDLADPLLASFIRGEMQRALRISSIEVKTGSLHAGTHCCDRDPLLHVSEPSYPFQQATPTFSDDLTIPWEGARLVKAVRGAAARINPGENVRVVARVSEGPEQREKLRAQLEQILVHAGADHTRIHVEVLCAFKQGYSWLMDEIARDLSGRNVASVRIDFAKNVDPAGLRVMYSPARWVQELYPVDEMLAAKLHIPLEKITFNQFEPSPKDPTYRVHAIDALGKELLSREFTVATAMQPYNAVVPRYEQVQVETGWVRLDVSSLAGTRNLLDQRIKTDIELFWDYYQNVTLPKVFHFVMAQAKGNLRQEFAPLFDTLKLDIHMSEPDYALGLDKERISSLEALQEDTFYATDTFLNMMGDLETGRAISYIGRVIPIVHASEDGKDGRVHIEFHGKPAANPLVRLSWTDARGEHHEQERNLPVIGGEIMPRLIQTRVKNGEAGVESLTWLLPADFLEDKYSEWLRVEGQDQVDRSIFSVEQARGELHWLEQMHTAGLYRDEIAYPHLKQMAVEFELPPALSAKENTPAERAYVSWSVPLPATPRPMITDYAPKTGQSSSSSADPIVQWNEPISPAENAAILARLATYPGVSVYWMGRSYLGQDIWAADITLPSESVLRSWAKETTLKASIIYSGRQHANEVSSTSHILKLGEELVSDPGMRMALKQVNVVLHPITNPDGAQLSVDLAKVTPDNLLHPGYHGSLSADVSAGQTETDPVYPESRTRRQLIEAWLPDAFLNPHGYPSHEWVQPFSEYTGWVQSRQGANPGRAWWIPRGWFTSLSYLRDPEHPYSMQVTYALRDRIVEAERNVPGLLDLEARMNARYERFGQRWQPRDMFQPIVNGIRIYMALKGTPGRGGGAGGVAGGPGLAGVTAPGSGGVGGLSPDITWDSGYTEAPDETAHGDYMKLMAAAGLAFDHVHLNYLAQGKLRITRTEREVPGGVQWRVERARPILPPGMEPLRQTGSEPGETGPGESNHRVPFTGPFTGPCDQTLTRGCLPAGRAPASERQ